MPNQTFKPLVSIIIPVYNGSDYMREAIDSALSQTYDNVEVIVVNDGSNDGGETERIAKEYGEHIRYIYKENGGVSTALNTGIKAMKGEYFSWLSHDDVYMPNKVENQIRALANLDDKSTLVCCEYINIDKNSNIIENMHTVVSPKFGIISWEEMLVRLFTIGPMHGCSLLIHKSVFENAGLFDETLRYFQDGYMWYKIFMKRYSLLSIPDICVKGRLHDKQLTQTGKAIFRRDSEKVSQQMIPELISISTADNNYLKAYINYNAKYGNKKVVKRAIAEAKDYKLISFKDKISIYILSGYGIVRPIIRKIYHTIFR